MSNKRVRLSDSTAAAKFASSACKRCRSRKVKCDAEFPSCLGCVKAGLPCYVADYSVSQDYTRKDVQLLEQKLADLESLIATGHPSPNSGLRNNTQQDLSSDDQDEARRPVDPTEQVPATTSTGSRFSRIRLTVPRIQEPSIDNHAPHSIPPYEIAIQAVTYYFQDFHICHPFLDEEYIRSTVNMIYNEVEAYKKSSTLLTRSQKHALFQFNMVVAIGSIQPYRSGTTSLHPFGFFTAALEAHPPSKFSFNSIEEVQDLLLIANFGAYYNIGCSIWELSRLCVRMCIELHLHQQQPTAVTGQGSIDQLGQRIFWETYLLDRFSSSILGRPFAIDDSAIETPIPADEQCDMAGRSGPRLRVFIHLIRLGQITSRMHHPIYYRSRKARESESVLEIFTSSSSRAADPRDLLSRLRTFSAQLKQWRESAPTVTLPSYIYESAEFFEISFQEARLWLLRAVVDELPAQVSSIREQLLTMSLQSARQIIECFGNLWENGILTYNRTYSRLILISGLVLVSVLKFQATNRQTHVADNASEVDVLYWLTDIDPGSEHTFPSLTEFSQTLETAERLLVWLATNIPDISVYARFFRAVRAEVMKLDIFGVDNNRVPESRQSTTHGTSSRQTQDSTWNSATHRYNNAQNSSLDGACTQTDGSEPLRYDDGPGQELPNPFGENIFSQVQHNGDGIPLEGFSNINDWSFLQTLWMDEIEGGISGSIWDTIIPWETSPGASLYSQL
ncbi:hypothetical protein BU24DRAFT_487082 [Aaosphaeria arxii CBS 175.79]|uniref:Zn(2)-C6 fungal-type domain-containing protein n=1 Tax=Aaosphaeria arxii CBS 175.79 TaxID=1450172 RepID=A0A6A5Y5H3_9PLEO|nr:uncharacterized protein BU24DRAFT_487082 [Aaosphaeria arxii CBS 175.79]KAF2020463.1 hypothetical protein BU24DRAFT_487082 [Aaosphaeria arxii CBS 175.79]